MNAVLASDGGESIVLMVVVRLIVIIAAARAGGWLLGKLGQPQVVGEILTGLLLGPSALGRVSPQLFEQLSSGPAESVLLVLGQLGLIFLMFVVGLEFEFSHLKHVGRAAAGVATAGIALPFALGAAFAWFMHAAVAADISRPAFVLFVATAMSITAIPILGRIMIEFGLTKTSLGVLTISAAAIDDAVGWILLAAVSGAVRGNFELWPVAKMLGLTVLFVLVIFLVVRPLVGRWSESTLARSDNVVGLVPFSIVLLLILASAVATSLIGVFSIFGPFALGAALSDQQRIVQAVRGRLDEFVTAFFLPIFFTFTGLRTDMGSLGSVELWTMCALLIATAVVGKMAGCGIAARLGGFNWRESASVAVMMNTRALMGLIAVNIGRDLGVIPDSVFCMMVLMAIATTIMTAPLLRLLVAPAARGSH